VSTYQAVITFGASAIQITDPVNGVTTWPQSDAFARQIFIEPLRTNAAIMSVGLSTVTSDGSGTGVISELSIPSATLMDRFSVSSTGSHHNIDPREFWVKGTSTQKCKVTIFGI
jgi:hypothetical protein